MRIVEIPPEPAVLINLPDEGRHAYLQAYPLLSGPRRDLNVSILNELPRAISVRRPTASCQIHRLNVRECGLPPQVEATARLLFNAIGATDKVVASTLQGFSWKCRDVPSQTRTILDIGCGDGMEMIVLRAVAPDARILGLDWVDKLSPRLKEVARIEFQQAHILEYLAVSQERFDVIFSNHVLEHMYNPAGVLTAIHRHLARGGLMLAALPLDGPGQFTWDGLARLARGRLYPVDLAGFDLGHPWKTTVSDLYESLIAAGFRTVRLVQREQQLNVAIPGDEERLSAFRARGRWLQRTVFGPTKLGIRVVFRHRPPRLVMRLLFAVEQRLWFGSANLKNYTSQEIQVLAQ